MENGTKVSMPYGRNRQFWVSGSGAVSVLDPDLSVEELKRLPSLSEETLKQISSIQELRTALRNGP
jgi:hypothetical protein